MLKKHLVLVLLMVMVIASVSAGTWKLHNYYDTRKIQNVYDMGSKVYYLNSNMLYQFDKTSRQTIAMGRQNYLSDNNVKQIYFDSNNRLLFVAYYSGNLDVIDSAGKVTNISGMKDTIFHLYNYTISTSGDSAGHPASYNQKYIYDITFADGIAYASTGFGYITIDESTLRIVSHKVIKVTTTITVNSIAKLSDETMVILSNANCYYGPAGEEDPIKNYTKYQGSFSEGKIFPIDDHSAFILGASALYHFDFSGGTLTPTTLVSAKPTCVQRTPNGFIANFEGQKYYYTIDATGKVATKASSVIGFASSDPAGDGTVWITDGDGLHIENSTDYYKLNSLTTDEPYWLKYNPHLDLLYAALSARNGYTVFKETESAYDVVNIYDGSQWTDATYTAGGVGYQFVINPLDSTTFVRPSWNHGLHKVTNNVLKFTYNKNNSPMGTYKPHPAFDNYGNMWIVCSYGASANPTSVLPKDKVPKNSNISKEDWFTPTGLLAVNTTQLQRSQFVISKLNNYKIYTDGDYCDTKILGRILCWDNFNEDPTVDDYQFTSISCFVDQFGKTVKWKYIIHMEEDADGLIWVGHTEGLFVFNPNVVFDPIPKATRPLITNSSEGSGYLCEGFYVYDIGIDRNSNKWIATNFGLYHVSPDGTTVYEHFTTYNSDIPSNEVYSVECDTKHDRVYIVTENGFAEYISNGDAAALNFDNVYAFPSPVEPDYTGMIKITNLMENTYVTITDKDGNVVTQLGPVMGSALWDGSGANGERVTTGIYNVYAAQGGQPATTGTPQTTIMIIR